MPHRVFQGAFQTMSHNTEAPSQRVDSEPLKANTMHENHELHMGLADSILYLLANCLFYTTKKKSVFKQFPLLSLKLYYSHSHSTFPLRSISAIVHFYSGITKKEFRTLFDCIDVRN